MKIMNQKLKSALVRGSCACVTAFTFSNALAAPGELVLTKSNFPGFSPPAYQLFSSCTLSPGRILLERGVGELRLLEERRVSWDAGAALKLARQAAAGTLVRSQGPTDLPSTRWELRLPSAAPDAEPTVLAVHGTFNAVNSSQAAVQLKNFLDQVCGIETAASQPR